MIRINLLPVKAAKRIETTRIQVLAGFGLLAVVLAGIVVFHGIQTAELQTLRDDKAKLSDKIAGLKREIGVYDQILAQRADLLRQKQAIANLERQRSGPAYFMRELSDLVSVGKGPTFDKAQYEESLRRDPNAAINSNWDPHRAWLLTYTEKDRQVQMHVGARSDEDVAEFLKRLKLSAFFSGVYWRQTTPQVDTKLNVAFVTFDVDCQVNY